eukprot:scaffold26460_cov27-Tisochrysis_lutea.AAC.3
MSTSRREWCTVSIASWSCASTMEIDGSAEFSDSVERRREGAVSGAATDAAGCSATQQQQRAASNRRKCGEPTRAAVENTVEAHRSELGAKPATTIAVMRSTVARSASMSAREPPRSSACTARSRPLCVECAPA